MMLNIVIHLQESDCKIIVDKTIPLAPPVNRCGINIEPCYAKKKKKSLTYCKFIRYYEMIS